MGTEENFAASAPYFLFLFSIGVATLCWKQNVSFSNGKKQAAYPLGVALGPAGLPVLVEDQVGHKAVAGRTTTLHLRSRNTSVSCASFQIIDHMRNWHAHPWGLQCCLPLLHSAQFPGRPWRAVGVQAAGTAERFSRVPTLMTEQNGY